MSFINTWTFYCFCLLVLVNVNLSESEDAESGESDEHSEVEQASAECQSSAEEPEEQPAPRGDAVSRRGEGSIRPDSSVTVGSRPVRSTRGQKPLRYGDYEIEQCTAVNCIGEEYECIGNRCYCATGYVPNPYQTACVRCPGLGERCKGLCCNPYDNGTLQCWQGVCQPCYDSRGSWICRDSLDQILLISITQVVMATALVLGIIATFVLLYKLCAATNLRSVGSSNRSRLSVGSLQVYVEERLRDAPPRYSRTAPVGSAVYPAAAFVNAGFVHDSSVPPPPYTPERKDEEDVPNTQLHI